MEKKEKSYEHCSFYDTSSYRDIVVNYLGYAIYNGYSIDEMKKVVQDPNNNSREVRQISRLCYNSNGIVAKSIDYRKSLPTLDSVICCKKSKTVTDVEEFLLKIRDKEFIRDCLFNDMVEGTIFYYVDFTRKKKFPKSMTEFDVEDLTEINNVPSNITVISLPIDYCKIIGFENSSPVGAFDLSYFNDFNGENLKLKLARYPKEIRDGYYDYQKGVINQWLILDNRKTIIHKIRCSKSEPYGKPLVLSALNDILYDNYYVDTKRNLLSELNNQFIYQTFPESKEKGISALTEEQQRMQHEAVKNAVLSKNSRGGKTFASVAGGTKIDSLTINTELFKDDVEQNLGKDVATDLGMSLGLLDGSGSYSAQSMNVNLMFAEIYTWIEEIAYELNKVINANLSCAKTDKVEVYYLPCSRINQQEVVSAAKDLYMMGSGSKTYWIASMGIKPSAYMTLVDKEKREKWDEKYLPHQTSYTYNGSNDVGRPTVSDSKNESTIATKDNNTNSQPKPSTNT